MDLIREQYNLKCITHGDIFEHLPTLKEYTKLCNSVAELGVSCMISTWSFLSGLAESDISGNKLLYCVDINDVPNIENVIEEVKKVNITMNFYRGNSIYAPIPNVDLLFIDTWHVYGHLKRELNNHHSKVNKYIIMHDTDVDGIYGESLRDHLFHDIEKESIENNYPIDEITKGLIPAITEFLAEHSEWVIDRIYRNNNGLTILKRIK
jgi:hypothetical protein